MGAWTKVVSEPLGLVGFALFLIFAYLGKVKSGDKRKWISPVAFACAAATLAGGFALAYLQNTHPVQSHESPAKSSATPAQPTGQIQPVQQSSTGPGSPNVQGVNGDVTITVDQSDGKTEPANKPK